MPYERFPMVRTIRVVIRTGGDATAMAQVAREVLREVDATQPAYEFETLDQALADSIAPQRFQLLLFGVFATAALVTVTINFAASFTGGKNIYANITQTSGAQRTWQQIGAWTIPASNSIIVNPSSGSGSTQTFTFTYTSPDESQEHFFFNSSLTGNGACYLIYDNASGNLYLANNQGSAVSQSVIPGSSGTLSNSQCSVPASTASVTSSGNTVTITATITFAPWFTGLKNIYANISNHSYLEATWQQIGSWTP